MPTCSFEETEAVRRYYAAFPALKKGRESPVPYYLPPPAWCRKSTPENKIKMQSEFSVSKDWFIRSKKISSGRERRNSYHSQRKSNKKRCNSYSRSFESKENLPEWVTHEGVWDMETQDPVKEFIRAIALDEGYGTCENTVTDEIKEITEGKMAKNENLVPDWDDGLDFDTDWVITEDLNPRARSPMDEELYAKFEAKFDRSIEALWSKDQNTPDDEYQDLPIDFQDLLSSPSDRMFEMGEPPVDKGGFVSVAPSVWSRSPQPAPLPDLRPLRLDAPPDPCAPYDDDDDLYDALAAVADTMRSFAAINHSRERSGFVEVPPRRRAAPAPGPPPCAPSCPPPPAPPRDDPLTSSRTHFRPVRREPEAEAVRHADGATFEVNADPEPVEYSRSESGGLFLSRERYLEYRASRGIDYGRLRLTAAQRCPDLEEEEEWGAGLRLRFPLRQRDAAVQTDGARRDRKRRHSAALRCAAACPHPHARFVPCHPLHRPLTR